MRRYGIFFLAAVATLLTGCRNQSGDTALYYPSGKAKPLVAVLPVIDSTEKKEGFWSLSEEFTSEIRQHVADSSKLFLLNTGAGLNVAQELNTPHMDEVPSHLVQNLAPAQFAIISEVIDEKIVPCKPNAASDWGSKIQVAMRVRVLDLRGESPTVALQEVIYQNQDISCAYEHFDYVRHPWGSARFANTPLGIVHNKVIRELVAHVEGYIGL